MPVYPDKSIDVFFALYDFFCGFCVKNPEGEMRNQP